jgi:hypothetical protein
LDDFEKETAKGRDRGDASKPKEKTREDRRRCDEDSSDDDSGGSFSGLFAEVFFEGLAFGGASSWERASGAGVEPREKGEAAIPFVRTDASVQRVRSDVTAWDARGESGYGPLAVEVRNTRYVESKPRDRMTLTHGHLLYRMSFTKYVEIDLGAGPLYLTGNKRNAGSGFTMPAHVFISRAAKSDGFGLEFRPVWGWVAGAPIKDYEWSFLYTRGGWSARAGYRWVRVGDMSLDGPSLGVSFHY